eukprot:EG_transcript_363
MTVIIDRIDGVQWVALGASLKNNVLGWLLGFVNVLDFLSEPEIKLAGNPFVLQLLASNLKDITADLDPSLPVRLTGHSLGGAVANLLAEKLRRTGFRIDEVVTFGAPKFVDAVSAAGLQTAPLLRRVTLEGDPVPAFPPLASYCQAGSELSLLKYSGGYRELAATNAPMGNEAFWLSIINLKVHPMANYLSRLAAFLAPEDAFLSKALAAANSAERAVAGSPSKTLSYPFQWDLTFQDSSNPILLHLCTNLRMCEVRISTTITVEQWTEVELDMLGAFPIQSPWHLGLVDIDELDLELLVDVARSKASLSACAAFTVSLTGDSYFFGMLKNPIQDVAVECEVSCGGFTFRVRILSWAQPFGISWLELRKLTFEVKSANFGSFAFSGQVVLFGSTTSVAAVYGPASSLLGMSIGYPNPIPIISLQAMTKALCSCELPSWADTLLRVAEFRGVQAQILMGSLRDIVIGGVTLRPGLAFQVSSFSLFWGLLSGSASVTVYVSSPRGWSLSVTLNEMKWFNGIVTLGPLILDVSMTSASFYFRFSAGGKIILYGSREISLNLNVEVSNQGISWDGGMRLGFLSLSKRWTSSLAEPKDLPIGSSIDKGTAQSEVTAQGQSWVARRVNDLTAAVSGLWDAIWGMIRAITAVIGFGFDAVKRLLGLPSSRKFRVLAACPAPDLSASPTGHAALAAGLDAALGCSVLQAHAYLKQVLSSVPLNHSHLALECLGRLPSSDLPAQLSVSLSGTLNVSTMSDTEVSQLIQYSLWYWPETSMPKALGCLVANLSNADLWDVADAVLSQWPQGTNSSSDDVQQRFLADMEQKGLDPKDRDRALQVFGVLLVLGDCGANQTAEDYQSCIEGDGLACPLYFLGSWRQRECLSSAFVAQQVLTGLVPGLSTAAVGKARAMHPLGWGRLDDLTNGAKQAVAAVVEKVCGSACQGKLSPIRTEIDRVNTLQSVRDNLAQYPPSLVVNTMDVVDGNVLDMARMASVTVRATGTFNGRAFDETIQVNPADPISEWMKILWSKVGDKLYGGGAGVAAAKWRPTATATAAPACQDHVLLRPPALQPGTDEAELWAYWNVTYGGGDPKAVTAPTDDQILAGYQSPAFLNNSWRICDPICGTCEDIGYRSVDPATNATVFRTTIPDFVPPGYNGTPAPPVFPPAVFPENDTAFADAPHLNISQDSVYVPVYTIDQQAPACAEPAVPPVPCDRCGAVRWPRACPPATAAGVLGCVVDVVSQSDVVLALRALTLTALQDATVSVSLWVSTDWQPLGSTRVSPAGAAAPFVFPAAPALPPNGTLRLRLIADQPSTLLASPTYMVPGDTFAEAAAAVTVVATWASASVQLANPQQCHLSVEVCRRCSPNDAETTTGATSSSTTSSSGIGIIAAAAAAGAA